MSSRSDLNLHRKSRQIPGVQVSWQMALKKGKILVVFGFATVEKLKAKDFQTS